jgi:uncharacterized caspase-like protein
MVDSFKTAEAAAEQKRREEKEAKRALAAKYAPQVRQQTYSAGQQGGSGYIIRQSQGSGRSTTTS